MTIPLVLHEANPGHHFQVGTLLHVINSIRIVYCSDLDQNISQ